MKKFAGVLLVLVSMLVLTSVCALADPYPVPGVGDGFTPDSITINI